jgi:serine/threonine-protein kinase RsbW
MTHAQVRASRSSGRQSVHELSGPPGDRATPATDASRTVRLPFGRTAVPTARAQVVTDLRDLGVARPVVEETESVVAELVANAVRHASALSDGTVRVRWQVRAGIVEVEVTDGGGSTCPRPLPLTEYGASGRGLRIVRSLAHEWGVIGGEPGHGAGHSQNLSQGQTVWASVGGPSRRRAT